MIVRELITRLGFSADESKIRKYETSLKKVESTAHRIGSKMQSIGLKMSLFLSAPIGILSGSFVKAASTAQELENKFTQVFGESAKEADQFAKALGESVGRSNLDVKEGFTSFQQFAQGLGLGTDEALKFSKQMTGLSLDFASFNDMSDQESMGRFISAMSGSVEVMDKFGINLKVAALDQELLNMGLKVGARDATELQKTIARANIIKKVMGRNGAIGDAVRTADSHANQMKRLKGEYRDFSVMMGKVLLPMATALVRTLTRLFRWFNKLSPAAQKFTVIIMGLVAAIGPLFFIIGSVVKYMPFVVTGIKAINSALLFSMKLLRRLLIPLAMLYLLYDDIATFMRGGKSLGEPVYRALIPVVKSLRDAWGWVWDKLKLIEGLLTGSLKLAIVGLAFYFVLPYLKIMAIVSAVGALIYVLTEAYKGAEKLVRTLSSLSEIKKFGDFLFEKGEFSDLDKRKISSPKRGFFTGNSERDFQTLKLKTLEALFLNQGGGNSVFRKGLPEAQNRFVFGQPSNVVINNKINITAGSNADANDIANKTSNGIKNIINTMVRQNNLNFSGAK